VYYNRDVIINLKCLCQYQVEFPSNLRNEFTSGLISNLCKLCIWIRSIRVQRPPSAID